MIEICTHDLAVSKFRCFHAESPTYTLRENSTFRSYYFLGGITPQSTKEKYEIYGDSFDGKRIICDFISGMTDDYATRFYEKLLLPRLGSIFDRM